MTVSRIGLRGDVHSDLAENEASGSSDALARIEEGLGAVVSHHHDAVRRVQVGQTPLVALHDQTRMRFRQGAGRVGYCQTLLAWFALGIAADHDARRRERERASVIKDEHTTRPTAAL